MGKKEWKGGLLSLENSRNREQSRTRSVMVVLQESSWVTLVSVGVSSAPLPMVCARPVCKLCEGFLGSQNT